MKLIFTDLDGTLLDHTNYSLSAAEKGLQLAQKEKIPIIFCTSKTRSEILYWRKQTKNYHPFISENGGGIFIPLSYFTFSFKYSKKSDSFYLIRFGASQNQLLGTMKNLEQKFNIESFISMNIKTIMKYTELPLNQAKLASKREFDIPFVMHDETQKNEIIEYIKNQNLHLTKGGRFYHLIGDNDKGKAVNALIDLFKKKYDSVESIGIGDSENDFSMLNQVDHAYLVKKPNHTFASDKFNHSDGIGPVGWQKVVDHELKSTN